MTDSMNLLSKIAANPSLDLRTVSVFNGDVTKFGNAEPPEHFSFRCSKAPKT
jgi:hypothetical protein